MRFFDFLTALWDWSRTIFGSVFVFCVIVAFDLLIVELFYYKGKKAREQGKRAKADGNSSFDAPEADAGGGKSCTAEQVEVSGEGDGFLKIKNADEVEALFEKAFEGNDFEGESGRKSFSGEASK